MPSGWLVLLLMVACSCRHEAETVFTEVPPSWSHIDFSNNIKEDEDYNILTYEYLYNGGGVAVGDLNNDGLPDILFSGNMSHNKLYLNKGDFRFEDITAKAGVQGRVKWKTGVVMADVNGDGLLDIYVCYSGPGQDADRANELYINKGVKDGLPVFTESAKQYGLDAPGTYTTTVSFFDMDNDGDLDMFMVNHADMFYNPFFNTGQLRSTRHPKFGNRLYRNDGGVFTDISEQAHIDGSGLNFGLSVSVSDINADGWPDIYVTNDYDERDFLYLNNHNDSFREVLTKAAGHISEFAMGSDIADYNNDGRPDIMVLDMLPEDNHRQKLLRGPDAWDKYSLRVASGFHHQQMRNTLQLNNGNDSSGIPLFSEVGQMAGVSNTDWSWTPLFADFDNDGWKDLFISNGILRDMTNLDFVKYTSGYSSGYNNKQTGNKTDMWRLVQQMPSTRLTGYVFRNKGDLGFADVTAAWGINKPSVNNGSAYADLDNDGDLDLVINNLNDKATLYRNHSAENRRAHFIKVRLKAAGANTWGIGAKVYVQTRHNHQWQEEYTARGFQSSVDPVMHIGLGADSVIEMLKVEWPGGRSSILENIKADSLLVIEEDKTSGSLQLLSGNNNLPSRALFKDITQTAGIDFIHQGASFVDFKISPLLPYQLSNIGPCLAKADINGDGLEDLFIGASAGVESKLYLQTATGGFISSPCRPWSSDRNYTISDALFFDADGDGDVDLYTVGGGTDYPLNDTSYQDRLYENDGHGNFRRLTGALPAEAISGGCVRAADINKDGLPDLFVGGRFTPGRFPEAPESVVLINRSKSGIIHFEKDTNQTDTILAHPGMVTDAIWLDINKDSWPDLVVVGQFMPISVFENHEGRLMFASPSYGLGETNGWWCRILADDFDKDGDTDLVVGNLGNNTPFKASAREPLTITYGDFYGNGVIEPILCSYNKGKSYPYFTKDEMTDQVPSLQKKFLHYADYADAQLTDLFTPGQLAKAATVEIKTTSSMYIRNDGNKKWVPAVLPNYAQLSALNGMLSEDIDGDGFKDIILAGNFYPMRAQVGPLDAGIGLILKGDGKGRFTPLLYPETGLYLPGDIRNLVKVTAGRSYYIVAAKNNGTVQVLERK